jgi:NTP pyrophosphatase (non-canonical NTP hydrolase)
VSSKTAGIAIVKRRPMFNEQFDLIRDWAKERGLYDKGDPKTQALKLVEEVGETCRAILKQDKKAIVDGIGDCVVVLVNLAELTGTPIEDCIAAAYNEIFTRTGKMVNGTFKKD